MSPPLREQFLRKIPSVDEVLSMPEIADLLKTYSRVVVVEAIRTGLGRLRAEILNKEELSDLEDTLFSFEHLYPLFQKEIELQIQPRLRRVINATGVVIHTNLGRSLLHPSAVQHLLDIARNYSNLEYNLDRGERGSRYSHVEEILCRLSGAESAMVVNNNAAAVLLALNTLAEGREVIVSRGELVEIGGAFRIPDVMKRSGAFLREVGTTNRTYISDYQKAIGPQTALLLKIHTSNFRVMGFTSDASLDELVRLGRQHHLPVMNDLGSGCLVDLTQYGLEKEPTVQEAIKTDVDVVTFSGDKLLGGPQGGIILGKKNFLDLIKINPLTRALRIDKLILAALESTLLLYLDEKRAMEEIPILRMLKGDLSALKKRGRRLLKRLSETIRQRTELSLKEETSQVGGGALPLQELPTIVLALRPIDFSVNRLEESLRKVEPPIISRISKEELILDMRTVLDEEIPLLAAGLEKVLTHIAKGKEHSA
ncbi:MAG: L-seryl-tRNA(Sec) selenium transferase [Deltaproteobacteria bacterium RBG_16_47_11]|nr:MAG: L-seryl-tRNA(Sec) selenium transferase [Deltaproteobacteria bacterium RBG_16_47_11]